ncbi:rhodanese-like domain-containing protein [Mucilaginibacter sp. AK015]|uniref:rhodanese-like domain-containing protein n=1 Tax=Mucilaginibacter sp. AK015 TaxID=2723072 RepID=UPI0016131A27|nr:rhodanese-like domain-containing protein [Mucilaginibacter sp. AK015]MBB5394110.1 adenylyltransferase/sulfurtransferase [Mucilaginibacter sp. AK015]
MHQQIDAEALSRRIQKREPLNLLDVREVIEYHTFNIGGQNIPAGKLIHNFSNIKYNKTDEIIVICSAGIRSAAAQALLAESGFTNVLNLTGGLKALQKHNSKQ